MNYWHMQLHPDDIHWEREKELLEKTSLIGLGLGNKSQIDQFILEIKIDDIVLIRRGVVPIALVRVISKSVENELQENDFNSLDWFKYRRKVEVLDFAIGSDQAAFPSPSLTIKKAKNENTESYKYIERWYKKTEAGIMIRHIYIENYKMFKTFNISFAKDNKPLPLIVLAGVNGSGKTTLLEYLKDFTNLLKDVDESYVKFENIKDASIETLNSFSNKIGEKPIAGIYKKSIIYIPFSKNIDDFKKSLVGYQKDIMYKKDIKPSESYQIIVDNIERYLGVFDLDARFDGLDEKGQIYFKNSRGVRFSIDELSSGQKTVLIKLLDLYIQNVVGKVILIDEPELSLHPSWQNKILSLYEKFAIDNNCQIIIATHSPQIIGSAKNEYIRVLKFDKNNNIEVINDLIAYGRDVSWVLEEVMDAEHTREKTIVKKIEEIEVLLNDEKFLEVEKAIDSLENIIGKYDSELVRLRTVLEFERD